MSAIRFHPSEIDVGYALLHEMRGLRRLRALRLVLCLQVVAAWRHAGAERRRALHAFREDASCRITVNHNREPPHFNLVPGRPFDGWQVYAPVLPGDLN